MIFTTHGETTIAGTEVELLADLCCIIRSLHEAFSEDGNAKSSKILILDVVNTAFISQEEVEKSVKAMNNSLDKIAEMFERLVK